MLQGLRERLSLLLSGLLVVVVAASVITYREVTSGPPFALAAMHARITNIAVLPDRESSQASLDRLAGKGRLNLYYAPDRSPLIAGQLDFDVAAPRDTDGQLVLFIIDAREARPLQNLSAVGPPGSNVALGWDGRFQRLVSKYQWLSMLAEQRTDAGYTDPGLAIAMRPDTRAPIAFEGVANPGALPITDPSTQLVFVLAYVGDSHGAWAERLPVSSG